MLLTDCLYTNYVLDKHMNFTKDENDEAKMNKLKPNLGEQLNEQMRGRVQQMTTSEGALDEDKQCQIQLGS